VSFFVGPTRKLISAYFETVLLRTIYVFGEEETIMIEQEDFACRWWAGARASLVIAVTGLLLSAFSHTLCAATLRVMPLGDSITAGYTDNPSWNVPFEFGYRSGLHTRLTNAGYDYQFVGGSAEPFNNAYGDPTRGGTVSPTLDLRPLGQDGHRGYGAIGIGGINSNVAGWITADDPDVILLLIGINGISAGSPGQLNSLVGTIFTAKPGVDLIVAQITPYGSFNQSLFDYNTYIRDTLVPTHAGNGSNITTVDLYTMFLTDPQDETSIDASRLANGLNHPSNALYDEMAGSWFAGIEAVGIPEPSTITLAALGLLSLGMIRRRRHAV